MKFLYDNYYEELPLTGLKAEVDHYHKLLIERLEKPEHKLALQIIESQDVMIQLHTTYLWTVSSPGSIWRGN